MTLAAEVRAAYDAAGAAWSTGPVSVYDELARPLVEALGDVTGRRVLDVGTGAGSVARLLRAGGADVVASDQALGMLLPAAATRPPAVVSDVHALPFRDGVFDIVTAGFVLNHFHEPSGALRELARVGQRLVATTFAGEAAVEVKQALESVARDHGFTSPSWYDALKGGPLFQPSADSAAELLRDAGLSDVTVSEVDLRLRLTPDQVLGWRWGMAQLAAFVGGLDAEQRADLDADGRAALPGFDELAFPVLVLSAQST